MSEPIDIGPIIHEVSSTSSGAVATFTGAVRDSSAGRHVVGLEYSAYEAMAVREMQEILREAAALEPCVEIIAIHRIGQLAVGDVCVVIAAAHAHRAPAFAACRYTIDEIKKRVPIWKRERYVDGTSEWVNACAATAP
ncbi:MAG: molybdenum cofactor biosynthesis protein MoaE [Gemmatimonadota bacterium]|nr:molybdenum cofactor biosynthesis protein MoaE [Gemmatimonadota bacterium]